MSKLKLQTITFLMFVIQTCLGQTSSKKEIYNADFKWTITIPENFISVSSEEWAKMQAKGEDAIEKTFNEDIVNQSKTIFIFKNDNFNYFESTHQPFDPLIDGDYIETFDGVNGLLMETFQTQMPNVKIDTLRGTEKIDGLEFQTFKMKVVYPNNLVYTILMFSRLFDKKELTVNIMFIDEEKGNLMLESWKKSRFQN
ncbi:hypothetical protein [Flavobacterium difficile]|uniref:Lipoprotein n=1 Tax=Flavobacterium difficile TaxID=2709659 RepID=A0ABX0I361_9FLAO|nr:hypothetical protein [Flavobacterium difficile]NHM01638.1 hypothetical protein [Flavobacterium difficile]